MSRTITVKGVTLGAGAPKICVPMVGKTRQQLKDEAALMTTLDLDVVEWRVDFFEQVEDIIAVKEVLMQIRSILKDIPLLFTFRSAKEGGEKEVSTDFYFQLNREIATTGQVELIDIELFNEEQAIKELIEVAHKHDVFVIISNHDFDKTPPRDEIVARLKRAQDLGGDIPKIAVMPTSPLDVLTLLEATYRMKEQYADRPIITMSMAGAGVISRIAGEVFGSALTFGAANKASAPGQVAVGELRNVLSLLHRNL
ncbi:3-dehydroquinate dehydratase-1 [Paenibacillus anaericanus]|uniref:type I 3-dehydroquinate dehydratase n=1 Tax=Paenibacillus anaericanus TaxID=170367 RepID=UPI0027871CF3|nr:type I 3-dehydroquinate dehydratase [Paenibacillus anaericanus]MDQ0092114.1 3-dehydroquinate dehydratase-1 [Paenibacillus anaericanus]